MPCCTCCCVKLDGECCGPDGNKVCCKDPDVCCGTGESQVCCENPRECCTVYEIGVGESEVCCTETQYCCNDGQGVCCEVGEICCIGDEGATCCESSVVCCAGVCCAEDECCIDDACVPCECESDEDCPEGECCNDGVCGECECEIDDDCQAKWHCCDGTCYPYQILCTLIGPGTPTQACKDYINGVGGDVSDCCPDLGYTVIGSSFDLSGEVLLSVNCAAPYPDCSEDNATPIYSSPVPEGYSVVNCLPDADPPDDPP